MVGTILGFLMDFPASVAFAGVAEALQRPLQRGGEPSCGHFLSNLGLDGRG